MLVVVGDPAVAERLGLTGLGRSAGRVIAGSYRSGGYWTSADDRTGSSGEILVLLPGRVGVPPRGGGKELYFRHAAGQTAPPLGSRVTFRLVDGYDKRKGRPSRKAAVDVRVEVTRG
jgi:hypothetical protein